MIPHKTRTANGVITVEESPTHHGMAWLNFNGSETPELTPHQMRNLAKALEQGATALETDEEN